MGDHLQSQTNRRRLMAFGAVGLLTAGMPWRSASAQSAGVAQGRSGEGRSGEGQATGPVERLNEALIAVMKDGTRTPFADRYRLLAPVVEHVFDLDLVLQRSVGLSWANLPDAQKTVLENAFRRYTVSSYLANFNSFNGQSFQVSPTVRPAGDAQVVVESRLLRVNDDPVMIDYVMRRGPDGWRAVDVLTNGAISRVAVQRSDFRYLLNNGGVPALTASLESKVASLSGGMLG
jgi:phospholipid transport system substrate-binding protein